MNARLHSLMVAGAAALALGAAGCKKEEPPPPPPPPAAERVEVDALHVGTAIGPDKRITSTGETFGTRDTIYASVETKGVGRATLVARWISGDSTVVRVDTQTLALTGPAVTEFHITRPRAWPVGNYKVEILLNGESANREDFEIR